MKDKFPSDEAFRIAAETLECEVAAIRAVASVECGPSGAFLPTDEPVILYEPHIFSRLTNRRFDRSHPDLSYQKWKPGAYGKASQQHAKLQRAVDLDRDAALKSCSWGLFQVMGENHFRAGHPDVQSMVSAAYRSVDDHLQMFVHFIKADKRLHKALRALDWSAFARIYNGPAFARNQYDTKMATAYKQFKQKE